MINSSRSGLVLFSGNGNPILSNQIAKQLGIRLGQISEFSLLIAFLAVALGLLEDDAAHFIQATAILTFLFSSYLVVFRYPSPIAVDSRLRKD